MHPSVILILASLPLTIVGAVLVGVALAGHRLGQPFVPSALAGVALGAASGMAFIAVFIMLTEG